MNDYIIAFHSTPECLVWLGTFGHDEANAEFRSGVQNACDLRRCTPDVSALSVADKADSMWTAVHMVRCMPARMRPFYLQVDPRGMQ